MQLTWLGHSCVLLTGTKKVLIDPFVEGGSVAGTQPDIVAVTHGHYDHIGEAVTLKKPTVAITELAKYLRAKGVPSESMGIGGTIRVDGVAFTMTHALHSSSVDECGTVIPLGPAAGFVIEMDGARVYHAGDTGLFSDMKLIGDLYHPDVAFLPIGGRYTMGIEEAMIAANFVGAKTIVPIHYNTFDRIAADPELFKRSIERTTDMKVCILQPGGSIDLGA